ncbi:MAG: type II secretion system F family protein, partial [bacterium]|nr:type II secretion system F family protein [bacterium]
MIAAFIQFFRSPRGRYILDKLIIKIPYAGGLLHKTSIEIFARVFHALYSESGDNLRVIKTAAEACRNKYMESRIKNVAIPLMLKDGLGLIESLEATGVFTKTALSRFRSGSEAGALKSASLQLANYYERETSYKMKAFIDLVNILISVVIVLVVIALTVVSSETAVIRPKMPGLKY